MKTTHPSEVCTDRSPSPLDALNRALQVCGNNQSELARRCGVKQPHVWKWLKAGRVPTERVLAVSRASGGTVLPHELRPDLSDIFPAPLVGIASAA
ncbi:transcriptional regulator [Pseudomonas brassicacearum]|uniref:transcriptional regulator n=1 Tax=Pseudomonas brassicacearum TaxID=930166 RepID=UPI0034A32203